MEQTVRVTSRAAVATVTLSRPDVLNAIDATMAAELCAAFREISSREEIRAVVLVGAGRAFSAGADLRYIREKIERGAPAELLIGEILEPMNETIRIIRRMPQIVIAAVHGVASGGGCNLALACDYRVAASGTRFNQAFIRLGLSPDCGGTFFVPRLIGWAKALEWMVSGEFLTAEEALSLGLIHRVVPEEAVLAEAQALAARLAEGPVRAIAAIKRLLQDSAGASLEEQLEAERRAVCALAGTEDFREGVRAFFEKRAPRFRGE